MGGSGWKRRSSRRFDTRGVDFGPVSTRGHHPAEPGRSGDVPSECGCVPARRVAAVRGRLGLQGGLREDAGIYREERTGRALHGPYRRDGVDDMAANGGIITSDDLRDYRIHLREPVRGAYRGYEIVSVAPTSSGGTAIVEMLNILEGFDVAGAGFGTAEGIHLLAESMKIASRTDSSTWGIPASSRCPWRRLRPRRMRLRGAARSTLARRASTATAIPQRTRVRARILHT